ncbi:hypothetical protein [Brevibacillus sp. MS2.2]|uniref:hypothetical protein n=1 Tax=Brevibacillus sp. MS2.2 TaxID=2738981 RepID=UPI00156B3B42|nr:hypothetical protein [Brevibacillus sp. MS2.2]NRR24374.1 hypothetical protein [Brevibacillus sp. MS2.2]
MELFLLCALLLYFYIGLKVRKELGGLKAEVVLLPSAIAGTQSHNTSYDICLSDYVTFPADNIDSWIVMVASATCPACHEELEQFLIENVKYNIPFFCLIKNDNITETDSFIENYKESVHIIPISEEVVDQMQIDYFPTFLHVIGDGTINKQSLLVKTLVKEFK